VAPAPQAALGLGANYFQSNGTWAASIFPKTAFIRFKHYGGAGNSLRLGRFEFIDGAERSTKNSTVNQLKAQRIAHRLIGNFSFAHVGRSFDGGTFDSNTKYGTLTLMGARATRGVFHVDGLGELDVDTAYAGFSRATKKDDSGEWRVFAISYHDGRRLLKTDNRSAVIRAGDINNIRIGTFGGHVVQTFALGKDAKGKKGSNGTLDFLAWGAGQIGQWGNLDHRAYMVALEAGYQFPTAWKPWLRGGWSRASGDGNNADNTHGTFFQILPTPRIYARFPFYNQMNNDDAFGELILRPHKQVTIRTDIHSLRLAEASDLWYAGGGAFEKTSFGYSRTAQRRRHQPGHHLRREPRLQREQALAHRNLFWRRARQDGHPQHLSDWTQLALRVRRSDIHVLDFFSIVPHPYRRALVLCGDRVG
jgi:hypothetical protein